MNEPKKIKKLPIKSYLVGLIFIIFLTTGVTYSKYITTWSDGDHARAANIDELQIYESGGKIKLLPGNDEIKEVKIKLQKCDGKYDNEIAYYIFLNVCVDEDSWKMLEDNDYTFMLDEGNNENNLKDISWSIDQYKESGETNWKYLKSYSNSTKINYIYYDRIEAGKKFEDKNVIKDKKIKVLSCVTKSLLEKYSSKNLDIKFSAAIKQDTGEEGQFEYIEDFFITKEDNLT